MKKIVFLILLSFSVLSFGQNTEVEQSSYKMEEKFEEKVKNLIEKNIFQIIKMKNTLVVKLGQKKKKERIKYINIVVQIRKEKKRRRRFKR